MVLRGSEGEPFREEVVVDEGEGSVGQNSGRHVGEAGVSRAKGQGCGGEAVGGNMWASGG